MANEIATLANTAVLISLNISIWIGRKKDKKTEGEVAHDKNATVGAASVYKNLFNDSPLLEAIKTLAADTRVWFNSVTIPWDDNGKRMLPMSHYLEVTDELARRERKYWATVNAFLQGYQTDISRQAFQLGAMFDRAEYPDAKDLKEKFAFKFPVSPLPLAGDFRVDIAAETKNQLQEQYEKQATLQIQAAMGEVWDRVSTAVKHFHERIVAVEAFDPDAIEETKHYDTAGNVIKVDITKKRRPKLHESMIDNCIELCGLLDHLNVTKDPKLDEARNALYQAVKSLDIKTLRESPEVQASTKKKFGDIMDKFNF